MQKHSDPSGFFTNSTGAPHGEEDGCIALASNNSSNYFLISNYSWGLCLYMDFRMGSAPFSRGISSMSPSFWFSGACVSTMPENTSRYLHNTVCSNILYFSSMLSKCGIAPSGSSLSPYKMSHKNSMGLLDVFNCLLYIILELVIILSGKSYLTNMTLVGRFF